WTFPRLRISWLLLPAVALGLYFAFRRLYPLIAPLSYQENLMEYLAVRGLPFAPQLFTHLLAFSIAGTTLSAFLPPSSYPSPAAWGAIAAYLCGLGVLFWRGDGAARRTTIAMLALAPALYVPIPPRRPPPSAIST